MKSRVFVAFALCALSGVTAAQEAVITPQPGKAAVVIYRAARGPFGSAGNTSYPIAFDEQWISTVPPGRYMAFPAWPGKRRIQPANRTEALPSDAGDWEGSSVLDLDVVTGETYYIKANPGTFRRAGTVAFELTSKEAAQKEFAGSKPVDWLKDLQEGTLAEVQPLSAQAGVECANVQWRPDIDFIKTPSFDRISILKGTVILRDDAVVLQLQSADPVGITIPYADIASIENKKKMANRAVVIHRKNGRLDSFQVTTPSGRGIHREETQACGAKLAAKLGG
jgi:hypothetical protein